LCRSLGFAAYVRSVNKKCHNTGVTNQYWIVNISGNLSIIPTKIKRKQFTQRNQIKDVLVTSFSVKSIGLQEYFGFEIDSDHIHLLGDFTLTHNSTHASGTFYRLKRSGVNCEYIQEYAKDKTWSEDRQTLLCQPYVTGKQFYRTARLLGKVDVAVTDSPVITGLLYQGFGCTPSWERWAVEAFNEFNNLNIFLVRNTKNHPYNPKGRNQTEEEARQKDDEARAILDREGIPYHVVEVTAVNDFTWDDAGLDKIYELVMSRLKQERESRPGV